MCEMVAWNGVALAEEGGDASEEAFAHFETSLRPESLRVASKGEPS